MKNKIQPFEEFQIELLNDFKQFNSHFEKSGIFWWAHSGTLLGFIRDGGLIQWDDDIDMAMTYKEFVKNKKEILEYADSIGYDVLDPVSNSGYDTVKVIKRSKRTIEWNGINCYYSPSIDIMLTIPAESKIKSEMEVIPMKLSNIFQSNVDFLPPNGWFYGKLKRVPKFFSYMIVIFKPILWLFSVPYVKWKFKNSLKFDDASWKMTTMFYNYPNKGRIYNLDNFTKKTISDFKVNIASDYLEELRLWFGNWKELPPKDKRIPHHLLLYREK